MHATQEADTGTMTYYSYWYRLDSADAYLVWFTDESTDGTEPDSVLLDAEGFMVTFRRMDDLQEYAARCELTVVPEASAEPLDLDVIKRWLATARKTNVDCKTFLNAWNLFSDLATTVQGHPAHIDGQREGRIYDKLFWGNNLPAVTPPGKRYKPIWSKSEVGRMRSVLGKGMGLFRTRLGPSDAAVLSLGEDAIS